MALFGCCFLWMILYNGEVLGYVQGRHSRAAGDIRTASRHELVKGLPDADFQNLFNCFDPQDSEDHLFSTIDMNSLWENDKENCNAAAPAPFLARPLQPVPALHPQSESSPVPVSGKRKATANSSCRFTALPLEPEQYRKFHKNKSTESKTKSHVNLFNEFLSTKAEQRPIHRIPPPQLDQYLQEFVICVRQKDGSEYEPCTLRSMINSLDRHLSENQYTTNIARGPEFRTTMTTLQTKGKDLKKQGKGGKPMAAADVTDEEVDILYKAGELGNTTPISLINTLWFTNTMHFGIRGGASEHRQLRWGDVSLGLDHSTNKEYLEFSERQTKTRTGLDYNNIRLQNPRVYATGTERCPIGTYKAYAARRPSSYSAPDHPFYLATSTKKSPGEHETWFLSGPIGVNKLKDLMKNMAANARLPELDNGKRITNTSVRKRLCQKLLHNDVPDAQAILVTGHKNATSLNNYRTMSHVQQKTISNILSSSTTASNSALQLSQSSAESTSVIAHNIPNLNLFSNASISGGTFHISIHECKK